MPSAAQASAAATEAGKAVGRLGIVLSVAVRGNEPGELGVVAADKHLVDEIGDELPVGIGVGGSVGGCRPIDLAAAAGGFCHLGGEGVPVFDDFAVGNPENVEGDERGVAEAVVGAVQDHELVVGDDARPVVAEPIGQVGNQGLQSVDAVGGQGGVLDVGGGEVVVGRRNVAVGEQLADGGGDKIKRGHENPSNFLC